MGYKLGAIGNSLLCTSEEKGTKNNMKEIFVL
jgi:hypothetical protein